MPLIPVGRWASRRRLRAALCFSPPKSRVHHRLHAHHQWRSIYDVRRGALTGEGLSPFRDMIFRRPVMRFEPCARGPCVCRKGLATASCYGWSPAALLP